eukprot:567358-Prorocentrum_minimum.AAC.2
MVHHRLLRATDDPITSAHASALARQRAASALAPPWSKSKSKSKSQTGAMPGKSGSTTSHVLLSLESKRLCFTVFFKAPVRVSRATSGSTTVNGTWRGGICKAPEGGAFTCTRVMVGGSRAIWPAICRTPPAATHCAYGPMQAGAQHEVDCTWSTC